MPKGRRAEDGVPKEGRLIIRHTDAQRKLLDQAASASGKPTSTWARDTLLQIAAFMVTQQRSATEVEATKKTARKRAKKAAP